MEFSLPECAEAAVLAPLTLGLQQTRRAVSWVAQSASQALLEWYAQPPSCSVDLFRVWAPGIPPACSSWEKGS